MPQAPIPVIIANIRLPQNPADGSIVFSTPNAGLYRLSGYLSIAVQDIALPDVTFDLLAVFTDNNGTRGDGIDGGPVHIAQASSRATPASQGTQNADLEAGLASVNFTFYLHSNVDGLSLSIVPSGPTTTGYVFVGVIESLWEIDLNP